AGWQRLGHTVALITGEALTGDVVVLAVVHHDFHVGDVVLGTQATVVEVPGELDRGRASGQRHHTDIDLLPLFDPHRLLLALDGADTVGVQPTEDEVVATRADVLDPRTTTITVETQAVFEVVAVTKHLDLDLHQLGVRAACGGTRLPGQRHRPWRLVVRLVTATGDQ